MLSWAAIKANHSAISTRRYRYMKRNGRKKKLKRDPEKRKSFAWDGESGGGRPPR